MNDRDTRARVRRRTSHRVPAGLACAAALVAAAHALPAPPPPSPGETEVEARVAEALKQAYLACDRATTAGPMDAGEVWRCSMIYETLKQRVFGGDFERLRAWSRRQGDG